MRFVGFRTFSTSILFRAFKVAQNSFQHLDLDALFIATLYHLMLHLWYEKIAQPLAVVFLWRLAMAI